MNETLDQKLATLKLGRIRQIYPSWVEQAAHSELGYAEFLDQLITEELLARQENPRRAQRDVDELISWEEFESVADLEFVRLRGGSHRRERDKTRSG